MKKLLKLVLLALIAYPAISLVISCSEEEDCSATSRPMTQCYLYKMSNGTALKDTLDSLTIKALGTDSVIINNQKKVHDILLPLKYADEATILVFHYSKTLRDTVRIYHTNTPYFVSMDCGYQMKQKIDSVSYSKHAIDSIHINNPQAGTDGKENLKLFYK